MGNYGIVSRFHSKEVLFHGPRSRKCWKPARQNCRVPHRCGYEIPRGEAVRRVLEKGEFPAKGLMQLYGEIGAPDGVSDRTVSRAIAKSVKQILEYGKLQVLLNRIGMNDVTPGDVIFLLANYLAGGTIKLR